MNGRPVDRILEEWRAAERALDEATNDADRRALGSRIEALREEHHVAVEALEDEARTLSALPR